MDIGSNSTVARGAGPVSVLPVAARQDIEGVR